ncbi:MAG TPA: histidine phosphatase family protein, partial [Mesorhizobium sp.]|nr:histidine phosphatase family protein [Mesorhizobium sp.]
RMPSAKNRFGWGQEIRRISMRLRFTMVCSGVSVAVRRGARPRGARERGPRDLDYGAWAGGSFAAVEQAEPQAVAAWLRDPQMSALDGERLADLHRRVAA